MLFRLNLRSFSKLLPILLRFLYSPPRSPFFSKPEGRSRSPQTRAAPPHTSKNKKIKDYKELAGLAGVVFYPLIFESTGRMDDRSLEVLKDLAVKIATERGSNPDYEMGILMKKVQVALYSANAGILVRRLNLRQHRENHQ